MPFWHGQHSGGSRHHWGTDIDVLVTAVRTKGASLILSKANICRRTVPRSVLLASHNIEQFGFYRPFSVNTGGCSRAMAFKLSKHSVLKMPDQILTKTWTKRHKRQNMYFATASACIIATYWTKGCSHGIFKNTTRHHHYCFSIGRCDWNITLPKYARFKFPTPSKPFDDSDDDSNKGRKVRVHP